MDTSDNGSIGRRRRRTHSADFKAKIVAACRTPGVSMAAVALANGLNVNLVRRWVVTEERTQHGKPIQAASAAVSCLDHRAAHVHSDRTRASPRCNDAVDHRRAPSRCHRREGRLAPERSSRLRRLATCRAALIRIDAVWLAVEPLDMRVGTESALARVVRVVGEARAHHAYLFANRRATRIKMLVHDGIGVWLCARRLHQGRFIWTRAESEVRLAITTEQLQALVIGLPWCPIGTQATIRVA